MFNYLYAHNPLAKLLVFLFGYVIRQSILQTQYDFICVSIPSFYFTKMRSYINKYTIINNLTYGFDDNNFYKQDINLKNTNSWFETNDLYLFYIYNRVEYLQQILYSGNSNIICKCGSFLYTSTPTHYGDEYRIKLGKGFKNNHFKFIFRNIIKVTYLRLTADRQTLRRR